MEYGGYIYILTNKNLTTLYTGVTNDLNRRVLEHKEKQNRGFTSRYNVDRLVYFESYQRIEEAILREKMIKKKSRKGKIILIESMNPSWSDLYITHV